MANPIGGALDYMSGGGKTSTPAPTLDWNEVMRGRGLEDKARAEQERAIQMAYDRATGKAPSVAQAQLAQATSRNIAEQTSMARSAGGGAFGEAAATNAAMQNAARAQQDAAGQAATLRANEQLAAEQAYAAQAAQMRGDASGQIGREADVQLGVGNMLVGQQANTVQANEAYASRRGLLNMATLGAAGALLSDERAKTDKRRMSDEDMRDFLEDVTAYWYRYKNEPRGTVHSGPMAQDLPHDMVREGSDGQKRIDLDSAYATALSALGSLHDRVSKLERGK